MKPDEGLEKVRDEVCRKIGRNLLFIQSMEQKLKKLIAINGMQFSSSGDNLDQRLADVSKKTMGILAGEFHKSYFADQGAAFKKEEEQGELSFSCSITGDVFSAYIKRSLASIVEDRNKLVHHFLLDLDNSSNGWEDAGQCLDAQHDNLVAGHKDLDRFVKLLRESLLRME